jgi:hypothetical protein
VTILLDENFPLGLASRSERRFELMDDGSLYRGKALSASVEESCG